ncbi:MAG: UPF0158 family protein [Candidatus Zixiibacteriota bacterium]
MAVRVSLQDIVDGMDFQSDEAASYLNLVTGKVVMITDDELEAAEEGGDEDLYDAEILETARGVLAGKDYVALPDRFEIDEYRMMVQFAESVVDQATSDQLLVVLRGSGAFRRFKDTVHILGLADNWYDFRARAYEETAIAWCERNGIEYYRE